MYISIFLFILLSFCLYTDIKYKKIFDFVTLPLFLIFFIYRSVTFNILYINMFIFMIVCTLALFKKKVLYGGDVKLFNVLSLIMGIYSFHLLVLSLFIHGLINKEEKNIMMPSICLGFIILRVLSLLF